MTSNFALFILLVGLVIVSHGEPKLVADEVDALRQIVGKLGSEYWSFDDTSCQIRMVGLSSQQPSGSNSSIGCECQNNTCHVVSIILKRHSLPGSLPAELVKLPYLKNVDFSYNYLSGFIPDEWASMQLKSLSVLVNRLSGQIPTFIGNMTSLAYLNLEGNQFSGSVPRQLGNLLNLETLILSSNGFTGVLPSTLLKLYNLADFRINDNNFTGAIPNYIQNWKQLRRLEMHASGLKGPIPSGISYLENLTELRISDIQGTSQDFPEVSNMDKLEFLVLRNCKISGKIPAYVWELQNILMVDLSFNKLVGEIPASINGKYLKMIFLTGNSLSGNIPSSVLTDGWNIDLSYNNFTWQGPKQPTCQENMNLNINLFRSSSAESGLKRLLPCLDREDCPSYQCSLHLNCGGEDTTITDRNGRFLYEGDAAVDGGAATYYRNSESRWGYSSTGDFMDDNDFQNVRFIKKVSPSSLSTLYTSARLAPISLTYYGYCLENGNYSVDLHFAEIMFTTDKTYNSLGKRIFDIYIQDRLVEIDFNIEDEAHGAQKPLVKQYNVSVSTHTLEIRFYYSGKGTTRVPNRGVYGPLISAISVYPYFTHCSTAARKTAARKRTAVIISGVVVPAFLLMLLAVCWIYYNIYRKKKGEDLSRLENPAGSYTLKEIKAATKDFDISNKIGEGGFGPVYKGLLSDGTAIAVKQLSSSSKQGNKEFLNEIGIISCLQHRNLVHLHGCCTEGDQLLLVYEYMENNSLAGALFAPNGIELNWSTRIKICVGISRGLAFLHEESRLKIVHRDIKATNVLLDRDLSPKISDFGLARLGEEDKTHISTRVAGTYGYMAPEYALWGYLTSKADVYSYGVLCLEVVSGKSNNLFSPPGNFFCLLDWACHLHQTGNYIGLLDEKLASSNFNLEEVKRVVKVSLMCTNGSPSSRPTMSEVVRMLEGNMDIPDSIPEPGTFSDDLRFKAMRDIHRHRQEQSRSYGLGEIENSNSTMDSNLVDIASSSVRSLT